MLILAGVSIERSLMLLNFPSILVTIHVCLVTLQKNPKDSMALNTYAVEINRTITVRNAQPLAQDHRLGC